MRDPRRVVAQGRPWRVAAAVAALACAAGLAAAQQPGEPVVIRSPEEEAAEQVAAGVRACEEVAAGERSVCLANVALAAGEISPCAGDASGECGRLAGRAAMSGCAMAPGSDSERAACQLQVATTFPVPEACDAAPGLGGVCLGIVASERRDPSLILARAKNAEERDSLLGFYAMSTGEVAAIDHIEDNYVADMATVAAAVTQGARSGEPLDDGFCWGLRGGYDEVLYEDAVDLDGSQELCLKAVRMVNNLNAELSSVESDQEREDVLRRLQELAAAAERGSGGSSEDEGQTLEELAGAEPEEAAIREGRAVRASADAALARCDFVEAAALAAELRSLDPAHPWLLAHADDVAARAPRQQAFRDALTAGRQAAEAALAARDPAALQAAASHAQSAAELATDACAVESAEAQILAADVQLYAEALREEEDEDDAGEEEDAGEELVDERDADEEVTVAADDTGEAGDWTAPEREDLPADPCRGPRPEYEAALHRLAAAIQREDLDGVLAAVAGLVPECPGDAARLIALRGHAVSLARAQAASSEAAMRSELGRSHEREAQRQAAWASAAGALQGILGELQRAQAASSGLLPPAGSSAGDAAATAPGGASTGPAASQASCMIEATADTNAGNEVFWVISSRTQACGRSLFLFGIRGTTRTGRVAGALGSFPTLGQAQAQVERLCPASNRATGQVSCQ